VARRCGRRHVLQTRCGRRERHTRGIVSGSISGELTPAEPLVTTDLMSDILSDSNQDHNEFLTTLRDATGVEGLQSSSMPYSPGTLSASFGRAKIAPEDFCLESGPPALRWEDLRCQIRR
jgi:hypothetical protein